MQGFTRVGDTLSVSGQQRWQTVTWWADVLDLVVVAFVVAALAAFAQAVSGFGAALVAAPLLTLSAGPRTAVVAITTLGLAMSAAATMRERQHVEWRLVGTLSVAGLVGMPLGLVLLTRLPPRGLALAIVTLVLAAAVLLVSGRSPRPGPVLRRAAGVLSGAMLTSTGMNGPPLVITLQAMRLAPVRFRGTLQAAFCAQDVVAVVAFALVGAVDTTALVVVLAGLPGLPVGWVVGDRLFARFDHEVFRRVVIGMLVLSALAAGASTLGGP